MIIEVKDQAALEKALREHGDDARILCIGSGCFSIGGKGHVEAWESSHVEARESSRVVAWGSSHVEAWGSSHVVARGSSHVVARGSSHVEARESSHVEAWESSHVEAWGSSHVEARGSSRVVAWESSHVVARGSSHVEAWESSHVVARGSSHVVARESSHVVARESSHVVASKQAAVHIQPQHVGKVVGGVQIRVKLPTTAKTWCEYYGVEVKRGIAVLFKAVRDDYRSGHGFLYAPRTSPKAEDWDGGKAECGGGLHFAHSPSAAKYFDKDATRYVACPVKLSEIKVHKNAEYPFKVKAPRVYGPIWECDIYGKPLEKR